MRNIIDMLEKLSLTKDSDSEIDNEASLGEMFDDLMRSVRRRFSSESEHITTVPRKCRKEAMHSLYSSDKTLRAVDRRRHSSTDLKIIESELRTLKCKAVKQQRRSEGSLIDVAKSKLLAVQHGSKESVPEAVARKLAERKRDYKVLTRTQTIRLMKIKYNLDKKSG